jgi:hypothetical protein
MQIAQDTNIIQSNANTESKKFGIQDMTLVMSLLTRMYSNPIQTLAQEYICNGRDANREIRQSKRMEITAPSRLVSNMIIRDFGPGISPERMDNVFLFYGSSTKRQTNKQTGGFGIGGKSAFAYTDSFTITTYIDGTKRVYLAHKSGGQGNLDLISETSTTEANGTAIEIAVKPLDAEAFRKAILRALYFWNDLEKPILKGFDSTELASLDKKVVLNKFKDITLYEDLPSYMQSSDAIVVIDGIPYPNRNIQLSNLNSLIKKPFAINLNTGNVEIAPNREEFIVDNNSQSLFKKLDEELYKKLYDYVQDEVNAYQSFKDGLWRYVELKKAFNFTGNYKQYRISHDSMLMLNDAGEVLTLGSVYSVKHDKLQKHTCTKIDINVLLRVIYDDMPKEAATKKVWRIRKTLKANNYKSMYLLSHNNSAIASELGAVNLSSIDASDYIVNRQAAAAVIKQELCLHYYNGHGLNPRQVKLSDISTTIVYSSIGSDLYINRHTSSNRSMIQYINHNYHKYPNFAFIAPGYLNKIKNNKNFVSYEDFIKNHKVTDAQMKWGIKQKFGDNSFYNLGGIKDKIKEPALKYFIELATYNPGNTVCPFFPEEFFNENHPMVKEFYEMSKKAAKFQEFYPLLDNFIQNGFTLIKNTSCAADMIDYFNTKYEGDENAS